MNKLNPEYFPVSSIKLFLETKKDIINSANEIKNKATIAEFPIRAGRTKKNKDNINIINENVELIFFAIIKQKERRL